MPAPPARPHVLMTTDAVGGVWTYVGTLAAGLAARGVRCTLAVLGPPPDPAAMRQLQRIEGVTAHVFDCRLEWMPGSDGDVVRSAEWLLALAERAQPDVVQINGYAHAAWPFGRPTLVVAHSCVCSWWRAVHGTAAPSEWDGYRARVEAGLGRASRVVAPTRAMLAALASEYAWRGGGDVIPNGLPEPRSPTAPRRRQIVAAGRLWDEAKNLSALDEVTPRLPWPVLMAGDACTPEGSRRAPRHARHLGRLTWPEVTNLMAASAIYALPAHYEPFGLSVLEAAQRGCALVLGDIASLRELWDGAAEFVPPEDREWLSRTLADLCADDARRRRLGEAARRRARTYGVETMVERYLALYGALAGTPRVSSGARQGTVACAS